MTFSQKTIAAFQSEVWSFYQKRARRFPWRPPAAKLLKDGSLNPYRILVSEVMLQQTQAERVIPFFISFLRKFPTVRALARAPTARVVAAWQGLGYNRRALYLKRGAEAIVAHHGGGVPRDEAKLRALPGIGAYTARAVLAFAWNEPVSLIETNIRTVYLHFFFKSRKRVSDRELLPVIEKTLPKDGQSRSDLFSDSRSDLTGNRKVGPCSVREWYYALMDYGAYLKKTVGNANRRSAHYARQTKFRGSRRALRGEIIRRAARGAAVRASDFSGFAERGLPVAAVFRELEREGFLRKARKKFTIA